MSPRLTTAALATALGLTACSGSIGQKSERPGDEPGPAGGGGSGMSGKDPKGGDGTTPGTGMVKDPTGMTTLPPVGSDPLAPDRTTAHCQMVSPGPAPVRRLTRAEYDNTIK